MSLKAFFICFHFIFFPHVKSTRKKERKKEKFIITIYKHINKYNFSNCIYNHKSKSNNA